VSDWLTKLPRRDPITTQLITDARAESTPEQSRAERDVERMTRVDRENAARAYPEHKPTGRGSTDSGYALDAKGSPPTQAGKLAALYSSELDAANAALDAKVATIDAHGYAGKEAPVEVVGLDAAPADNRKQACKACESWIHERDNGLATILRGPELAAYRALRAAATAAHEAQQSMVATGQALRDALTAWGAVVAPGKP
jgi:hypothetical protein